jgi:hypothetical protein
MDSAGPLASPAHGEEWTHARLITTNMKIFKGLLALREVQPEVIE